MLSGARRELYEETGLTADLWLCGVVMVDAGETGICLFVFTGKGSDEEVKPSAEGQAEWIPYHRIVELPVVEDLPILLGRINTMRGGDPPFMARSVYGEAGNSNLGFAE